MDQQTQDTQGSDAPSWDVPDGQYKARGVEGSEQWGGGDKGDQLSVELVLVDVGRIVTTIMHLSEAALPYTIDRLKLLGVPVGPDNEITTLAGISKNEVPVMIRHEEYNGETRMKAEIISSRFSFKKPLSPEEIRANMARINAAAKQRAATHGVAGGTPKNGAPAANGYPENWDQPDPNRPALNIS